MTGRSGVGPSGVVTVLPVTGLPEVARGDDLAGLVTDVVGLVDGDVVVVAQKVVSKAEGALAWPRAGESRAEARSRLVREQSVRLLASAPHAAIVETRHGLVCANAGIDASNVPGDALALLPHDPDASARRLRDDIARRVGVDVAVIVSDTFGRPWRLGQTEVAIGCAGLAPLRDERDHVDRQGHTLHVTEAAVADELAGAADLVRRKADGVPVVVVRGYPGPRQPDVGAGALLRSSNEDLFPRGRGAVADRLAGRGDAVSASPPGTNAVGSAVPRADLDRAMAAGERAGRDLVELAVLEDSGEAKGATVVGISCRGPDALVEAGACAGALVAALIDLGYDADHRRPRTDEAATVCVEVRA